jgi:transcriptional regulator with XRE-family HTH domain
MPTTTHRRAHGSRQARKLLRTLAEEVRIARTSAGLSQRALGQAVGVSGAHIARLERAEVPGASVTLFTLLFSVLGMRLSARPYPEGPSLRDIAQARLLARFASDLPQIVILRTEVVLRIPGDPRAWDGELEVAGDTCKLEAETVLYDLQATDRRIALKMADDQVDRVILLVADTHRNRRVLREFRQLLANRYPADTREVRHHLRQGRLPPSSGVVLR